MFPFATITEILWWVVAVGLAAGLAASLVWYSRQVSLRRLPAPGFFLVALGVHVLLVIGSFFVYLDTGTGAQIRRGLRQIVAATRLPLGDRWRRSLGPVDEGFGNVADLRSAPTEDFAPGPGTAVEAPGPPAHLASPEPLGRMLPPARFGAPAVEPIGGLGIGQLARRHGPVAVGIEAIEIEPLRAAAPSAEQRIEAVGVGGDRPGPGVAPGGPAVLPGPAPGPSRISTGPLGRGTGMDVTPDMFAPAVAEVPRMNRAARPVAPFLPDAQADLAGLPAGGSDGTGRSAGSGGQAGAGWPMLARVDVVRPEIPGAPAPVALRGGLPGPGGPGGSGRPAGLPRPTGGILPAGEGLPGQVAASGLPPGLPSGSAGAGLARRGPRSAGLMYAEDSIGLQAMFRMRQNEDKQDLATATGATAQSLAAVHDGLKWLAQHQHKDGYWSLNKFYNQVPGRNYSGAGNLQCDVAATGFALLPLLGDGHTHVSGEYQSAASRGLNWLLGQQKPSGELSGNFTGDSRMYTHAIAAIVLCEAYGMTKDPRLSDPAQRALDFITSAQHKPSGGWRYNPQQAADTSVVGWQVMAMKSGQMAGLKVSQESLDLVHKWLRSVEGSGPGIGTFRYQSGSQITPAMTAEGLLCLEYLGTPPSDPRLQSGVKYLLGHLPRKGQETSYYWYYGTQVMYHVQGDAWQQWNLALRDMLVATQVRTGHLAGTWDPGDQWEQRGGRVFATALRLLMLEVYYRHLPLYQILPQ